MDFERTDVSRYRGKLYPPSDIITGGIHPESIFAVVRHQRKDFEVSFELKSNKWIVSEWGTSGSNFGDGSSLPDALDALKKGAG